jgi:hypothetical protein
MLTYIRVAVLIFVSLPASAQADEDAAVRKVSVAVWIGRDCPISQKYIFKLNQIYGRYRSYGMFEWHFIIPEHVTRKTLNHFIQEYDIRFPLTRDNRSLSRTRAFKATVTPEVIIMSDSILYRGAIDNWFYELGKYRQTVTENYMGDALDSILKGEPIKIKSTMPVGCPITYH